MSSSLAKSYSLTHTLAPPQRSLHQHPCYRTRWISRLASIYIQAIQNLLGVVSDLDDFILPLLPHPTDETSHVHCIQFCSCDLPGAFVGATCATVRPIALLLGLIPVVRTCILLILLPRLLRGKSLRTTLIRTVDDVNLEDHHWNR